MEKILNMTAHDIVEYKLEDCDDPQARHLVLKDQEHTSPWEVLLSPVSWQQLIVKL